MKKLFTWVMGMSLFLTLGLWLNVATATAAHPLVQSKVVKITGGYEETTVTQQYKKIGTTTRQVQIGTRTETVFVGYRQEQYWYELFPGGWGYNSDGTKTWNPGMGWWETRQVPVYETRTIPVYETVVENVYGWVDVTTKRWVPVKVE